MNQATAVTNPEALGLLNLVATDVTGINKYAITDVSPRSTIGELIDKKGQYKMEEKEARKYMAEQDVQYGFQIGISTDETAIRGYSYFAAPLMEPEHKDSLDEMGDLLMDNATEQMSKRKRLPAPDAPKGNGRRAKAKTKAKTKRKSKAS